MHLQTVSKKTNRLTNSRSFAKVLRLHDDSHSWLQTVLLKWNSPLRKGKDQYFSLEPALSSRTCSIHCLDPCACQERAVDGRSSDLRALHFSRPHNNGMEDESELPRLALHLRHRFADVRGKSH